MAFAQGSRSQLLYIKENTFNTTPSTPAMNALPIGSHDVGLTKELIAGEETRSDRQVVVERHGNKSVAGSINVSFRPLDYDELLEGALFGEFNSSDVLKLGTDFISFSFEKGFLDVSEYTVLTGCAISSMSMNVSPNALVGTTFNIVGAGGGSMTSSTVANSVVDPSSEEKVFDSFSGSVSEGGSQIAIVTSLEFTVDNGIAPAFVVGDDEAPQMEVGTANVTGTLTVYFEDETLYDKFLNETESSLQFVLSSTVTGETYTFDFPRVKYNTGNLPVQNQQSVPLTLEFRALKDGTEDTTMKVTKS